MMSERPYQSWTEQEVDLLKEKYATTPRQDLLEIFEGRTWQSIRCKAQQLGLKRNDDAISKSRKFGNKHRKDIWSDEEINILKQFYPIGGSKLVNEKIPHRNRRAIITKANELGIRLEDREDKWEREVNYEDDGSRRAIIATYTRIN